MWLCTGGAFDPLGLASADDSKAFRLKTAEIKHGRLAMIAFLGKTGMLLLAWYNTAGVPFANSVHLCLRAQTVWAPGIQFLPECGFI